MIIEISVAVIAIAFSVLVIYLILTLKSIRTSLVQANETLIGLQTQLDEISQETIKLIQNTNVITLDVQSKIKSLDNLFDSIKQVSESVHQVTSSAKEVSAAVSKSLVSNVDRAMNHNQKRLSDIVEWGTLLLNLWNKWKKSNKQSE